MSSILVGFFDTQAQALQARSKLLSAGFDDDEVTVTGESPSSWSSTATTSGASGARENEGAISRFFRSLFGSDDVASSDVDGATYQEAFRRGAYSVSVITSDETEEVEAEQVLNEAGAIDVDDRSAQWRKEGWTLPDTEKLADTSVANQAAPLEAGDTRKFQEVEEELKVGKRAVARGGVRVFQRVTEVPVQESVRLREEHANVQRKVVDRPATEADLATFKEGSIEVREMAEEAVVSKSARVVGEVEVEKIATEHEESIKDTVRKTKVEVEKIE